MPIRFLCLECAQLLSIGTRKAGTQIECPKCGAKQTVPGPEAVTATVTAATDAQSDEDPLQIVVYDDAPVAVATPRESSPRPAETIWAKVFPGARDAGGPRELILLPRHTLYVHAGLFLVVAVVGFSAGYAIGRGSASLGRLAAEENAAGQRVLVEGKLVYDPGTGHLDPDADSVVILLPEANAPKKKISTPDLRPADPPPPSSFEGVRRIKDLGGVYLRADAAGTFSTVLPDGGKYYVLLISQKTRRPPDSAVETIDSDDLGRYFVHPGYLIGQQKYRWTLDDFVDRVKITHNFGRDQE
jgi:DNA-directed RNA polymerase subunit RPC12/RpoP